jgi:GntR family transcriptional regulator
MLTIRLDSPTPLIDQIASGIRSAIARSELDVGDALPTVRQLAGDLGINLNTVARAYRALEAEGLVQTRRGRGTMVTATRSRQQGSKQETHMGLEQRLREVLVDLRLAGLPKGEARAMVNAQLTELWAKESRS